MVKTKSVLDQIFFAKEIIKLVLGAIQLIRDTLRDGGFVTVSPNDTGGRGSTQMSRVIFCPFLN